MSIITSILRRSIVISSPAIASPPCISQIRAISSSIPRRGLEEFFDPNRAPHEPVSVGRAWTADELRRKSFDDLHKLWYVLYKERNVLMTEELACKRNRGTMPAPHRKTLVRKSMARMKLVLREREIAERKARQEEEVAAKPQAASS